MYKLNITNKIEREYSEALKEILLTPTTKKFNARAKRYFSFIKNNLAITNKKEIEKLIIGKDIHLLVQKYGEFDSVERQVYEIYENMRKVFGYRLVKLLNIKVCPYCNRNYITNFANKTTVTLDHYYPKSKYPYLAINLHNLIPVCSTCNHKKGNDSFKIYPYKESIDDYITFKFSWFNDRKKLGFFDEKSLKLEVRLKKRSLGTWDYKKYIEDNYQNHKDIIAEILKRQEMYPQSRIEELYEQFGGRLFSSKDELLGLVHCNFIDKKDINKRPLSKLTKDILEQVK